MPTPPTDNLESVVNAARMRLNDMIAAIGGDILQDTAPFTPTVVNAAWRKQQDKLMSLGYPVLTDDIIFEDMPAALSSDASFLVYLDWTGYYNGTLNPTFALPQYMIEPIRLDERVSVVEGNFLQMDRLTRGLPLASKGPWQKFWEWHSGAGGTGNGAIWMPGTTGNFDLRIKASVYLPDFVPAATTPFQNQPVPIIRCQDSFSLYIVAEMCAARGDLDAKTIKAEADAATVILAGSHGNPGGVLSPAISIAQPSGGAPSQ
jgi:hypothetical protein